MVTLVLRKISALAKRNISIVMWERFNMSFKSKVRMKSKGIAKRIFNDLKELKCHEFHS